MTERAQEIAERLRAATQGKWWVDNGGDDVWGVGDAPSPLSGASYPIAQNIVDAETAEFIAHCGGEGGDVAWLLAGLTRAESELAQARADRDALQTAVHELDAECHTHLTAAREAEVQRDAALRAVADVDQCEAVYCSDGEDWFKRHNAVIKAARKLMEEGNG